MESWWHIVWPTLLVLSCFIAWVSNFVTLPGNWIAAALVLVYYFAYPENQRISVGTFELCFVIGLALFGEILEMAAGALGAKKAGASTKSTIFAVIGSMSGAMLGAFVGLPIPMIGSIVAALLFGALGATAGAMFGEWTGGKTWEESIPVGNAAFWGRLLGTVGKVFAGVMILLVVCISVCF